MIKAILITGIGFFHYITFFDKWQEPLGQIWVNRNKFLLGDSYYKRGCAKITHGSLFDRLAKIITDKSSKSTLQNVRYVIK